ncbi:MAG: topoisomerase DNA-binding C4 zinc finger domain-containing protein [Patescibacteria group bacterium]
MAADPEIVNATKILTSTVARILIPFIIIIGIIVAGITYFKIKLFKKVDEIKKRKKDSKNNHSSELNCPLCGNALVERSGKFGSFYGCSIYPKCKYTKNIG